MKRHTNIDLMKIICALMVLIYHTINTLVPVESFSMVKQFFVWGFFWGRIAVDAFVIISSWYLCGKGFSFKRILSSWISTFIYSVIVGAVFAFGQGDFEFFLFHLLPISTNVIWFMRAYILMLLMSPVMNFVLEMDGLRSFLMVMIGVFSIYKTLYPGNVLDLGDWEIFLLIYLITGYVKKNIDRYLINRKKILLIFLTTYFVNILWYVFYYNIIDIVPYITKFGYGRYMFNTYVNNVQCMLGAFALFGWFKSIKINKGKISNFISWISDGTPDVYILLAMNSPDGRLWWVDALKVDIWIYGDKLLPRVYFLCLCLCLFLFVVCIGHIRIFFVNKLMKNSMILKLCKNFDDFYIINGWS